MKTAKDLTRDDLEDIVTIAQEMFWSRENDDQEIVWDRDTEWSWERVEEIAGAMTRHGLCPQYGSESGDEGHPDEPDTSSSAWREDS